jgi:hypothetical protein
LSKALDLPGAASGDAFAWDGHAPSTDEEPGQAATLGTDAGGEARAPVAAWRRRYHELEDYLL